MCKRIKKRSDLVTLKVIKKKLEATQDNKITLAKRREIHTDEQDFFRNTDYY